MEAVWPITALYFGPLALWAYYRWGRPMSHKWMEEYGEPKGKSFAASVAVGDSHCGAGCTLGDIIGSPAVVFLFGWKIFGLFLFAKYVVDYALAYIFGIAFQYYSIKPMQNLSVGQGIKEAIKADTLSLTAFQVGLFVDGGHAAGTLPGREAAPQPRRVLVPDADRDDPRFHNRLPRELVAHQAGHKGGHVETRGAPANESR